MLLEEVTSKGQGDLKEGKSLATWAVIGGNVTDEKCI